MFKKLILIILFSLMLLSCSSNQPSFRDNFGHKIEFSQLRGKWIIINYWASWCQSCSQEIPELNQFYQKNKNKKVLVFGVNYDGLNGKKLQTQIKHFNIQYPVLLTDPSKVLNLGRISVLPMTFIINPQGRVVRKLLGPQTVQKLEQLMALLNKSKFVPMKNN